MSSENRAPRPVPRRKLPNRAKSSDGSKKITSARPAPPARAKSMDGSSMRNLMTKANSVGKEGMRGLLATADSAKNIMVAGTGQAVKVHTMLSTKAPKARPGAVAVKSLSSKHIGAGVQSSREKIPTGSNRNRSKSRGRENTTNETRRIRRPDGRSLTPSSNHSRPKDRSLTPSGSDHKRPKDRVIVGKDDDSDYLAIM